MSNTYRTTASGNPANQQPASKSAKQVREDALNTQRPPSVPAKQARADMVDRLANPSKE